MSASHLCKLGTLECRLLGFHGACVKGPKASDKSMKRALDLYAPGLSNLDVEFAFSYCGLTIEEEEVIYRFALALDEETEKLEKVKEAIRKHHRQKADDRCWLDDNELYRAAGLPEADIHVGDQREMLKNCERFLSARTLPGKWRSYAELEAEVERLKPKVAQCSLCRHSPHEGSGCGEADSCHSYCGCGGR